MSGAMPDGRNAAFQDRLKRIKDARAPDPVDLVDEKGRPIPDRTEVSPLPDWKENIRYPASLVLAAFGGMIAVFFARYARFHLTGAPLTGADADITMMIDGGIAAGASFLIFTLLRFEGPDYKFAQTVGIAAMVCVMHNAVHAMPRVFNVIFSPEWTAEVVAATEPGSILFRGVSFVVMPDEETKPKQPSILRL